MNPSDVPSTLPKITLPAWAYLLVTVFAVPVGVAYLTHGDVRTALATALTTIGLSIGAATAVAAPKIRAAALVHREFNLGAGYAQAQQDARPPIVQPPYVTGVNAAGMTIVSPSPYPAKKAPAKKRPAAKKAAPRKAKP